MRSDKQATVTFKEHAAVYELKADRPTCCDSRGKRRPCGSSAANVRLQSYLEHEGLPVSIAGHALRTWTRYVECERINRRGPSR